MSATGDVFARAALNKLLQKAERAWAREAPPEGSLLFSESSLPEYFQLPLRSDKDTAHAELRSAERQGAIKLEWERRAGPDGQITRMTIVNADRLASHLGRHPAWTQYVHAEQALAHWRAVPAVKHLLARWRQGKQIRGLGAQRATDCVDACRVIDACRQQAALDDVPVRRFSAALFADSKHVENITTALDLLTGDDPDGLARDADDVLRALGLVKFKQPALLAGTGTIELTDGQMLAIPSPYVGLSPQSIKAVHGTHRGGYLLSVENLTIFHELALGRGGRVEGILIYTAGMPPPSLQRVYALCAAAHEPSAGQRWHWGDIDLGGFRIAAVLAALTDAPLHLWSMDPSQHPGAAARKTLSTEERSEITAIGRRWGWSRTTESVAHDGRAIEQESLPNTVPVRPQSS